MKKLIVFPLLSVFLLLAACSAQPEAASVPGEADATLPAAVQAAPAAADVPAMQADPTGLAYVREEEKLAHDVYLFLYERWNLQVFQNIAASEQTHTDTIATLLLAYNSTDPAAGAGPGAFADPNLQALYDELTARGSLSLADALEVGAAVEEIDILDLQSRLQADLPDDIRFAYESLLSGSYNHLGAFTSTLQRQTGEVYVPQYMIAEAYQDALSLASAGGIGGGNGYHGGRP
jgi:hypothetical protein